MNGLDKMTSNAPGVGLEQYPKASTESMGEKTGVPAGGPLPNTVDGSKALDSIIGQVKAYLPDLVESNSAALANLGTWVSAPAPGALVMSLITEMAAEQRRQNRQEMWAQTEATVKSMQDEAKKMKEMANIQLALGLTGAALTVAGGIAQTGLAFSALAAAGDNSGVAMLKSTRAQGVGTAVGGAAGIFSSVGQFIGTTYQAECKTMQADQEKMRALRDSLKDFNDSLNQLIQKAVAASDSIQQSMNQTRAKILA
ncbi:MAG: hypothetical protein LBQ51_08925 [Desulfovibrio sp.]|jgi:hypothetical protein|nr:hypothetical protein [Desulfovibrio sp.]